MPSHFRSARPHVEHLPSRRRPALGIGSAYVWEHRAARKREIVSHAWSTDPYCSSSRTPTPRNQFRSASSICAALSPVRAHRIAGRAGGFRRPSRPSLVPALLERRRCAWSRSAARRTRADSARRLCSAVVARRHRSRRDSASRKPCARAAGGAASVGGARGGAGCQRGAAELRGCTGAAVVAARRNGRAGPAPPSSAVRATEGAGRGRVFRRGRRRVDGERPHLVQPLLERLPVRGRNGRGARGRLLAHGHGRRGRRGLDRRRAQEPAQQQRDGGGRRQHEQTEHQTADTPRRPPRSPAGRTHETSARATGRNWAHQHVVAFACRRRACANAASSCLACVRRS